MSPNLRTDLPFPIRPTLWLALAALSAPALHAQLPVRATPQPAPWGASRPATPTPQSGLAPRPGLLPSASPSALKPANQQPPRDVPLVEKKFEALSDQSISDGGQKALSINPAKWKHAETDNFILHYRRVTEAQKVAREVEYDLWYVASTLGATKDRYQRKSHVYVFEDEDEWKNFLSLSNNPNKWAASYAFGDELYLNVRGGGNSGAGASFDSHTLAHETTHAVVARLYRGQRWPLWMNEGFAEYMGGASVAARKGITVKHFERDLRMAEMPLDTLAALDQYPGSPDSVHQLYQTSEKFVRFLMTELPKERIVNFIDAVVAGKSMQEATTEVYGDKIKDWNSFLRRYERFTK